MSRPEEPSATDMEMSVAEEQSIVLPSLGTAGYVWEYDVEGPSETVSVDTGSAELDRSAPVGLSAPCVVTIRGLQPGVVTVHMVQRRPWETGVPPLNSHSITVNVKPA